MNTAQKYSKYMFLIAVLFVLILPGCLQIDQTLTLNRDGSGTIALAYGISEQNAARMGDLAKSLRMMDVSTNEPPGALPFDLNEAEIQRDFKEYEPYGVTLRSAHAETTNGWKFMNLVIDFKTLEGLFKSGFLSDRQVSLERNRKGQYVFTQTTETEESLTDTGTDSDAMLAELMKGFRAVLRFRMPGKILNTNAPDKTDFSAIWTFDLEKDADALKKAQRSSMQITFDGRGLTIPDFRSAPPATP